MTTPPIPASPPPAARSRSRLPWIVAGVVALAIVVAVLLLNGRVNTNHQPVGVGPTPSTPGVVPPDAGVVAEGRAVPLQRAEVAFSTAGRVFQVLVAEGDTVAAGEVLAWLDNAAAEADLDAAEAAVRSADASVTGAEASVHQAQANVDAARAAVNQAQATRRAAIAARDQLPSGASSAATRQANAEVAGATAGVDAARAQLLGARAALDGAEASLAAAHAERQRIASAADAAQIVRDEYGIRAPIAGTVVTVDVQVGNLVQPGEIVVRLADLSSWRFEATDLSETSIARVTVGALATVTVDGLPGEEIPGTVESVGGYGTESQGDIVFRVVVAPSGAVPDAVRWNMTVTMEIDAAES